MCETQKIGQMKLVTLARASSSLTTKTTFTSRTTPLHNHFFSRTTKPISSSSLSYKPTSINPKPETPLHLRPPIFTTTSSNLTKFQEWAKTLNTSVSPSFTNSENLDRELNWLIQDALQDPSSLQNLGCQNDTVLEMRAELGDLFMLWKQRIEKRRPFQYIVGCEYWRDLVLCVEEGVLIPRPETELIVDFVDDLIKGSDDLKNGLWVDLGTGSGAIGIGIARVLGEFGKVVATDLSPFAVRVASYNVERYNLQDKISVRQGSWFEPLTEFEGQIAGLVSNPPYIPSEHISGLQPEVGRHEPILALDGGEDGMSDLLHLCNGAALMLKPCGFFAFETNGEDQCTFLVEHLETVHKGSFDNLKIIPDFAGIKRFVTGIRL